MTEASLQAAEDRVAPAAPPLVLAGALAVGLFGSIALPGNAPGLGLVLTAVAGSAAVALGRPRPLTADAVLLWGLALGLMAMFLIRDAAWVLVAGAAGAAGIVAVVATAAKGWGGIALAPFDVVFGSPRAPGFLGRPVAGAARGIRPGRTVPVVRGLIVGLVLVVIFGALFASADAAFAHIARRVLRLPEFGPLAGLRVVVLLALAIAVGTLVSVGPRYTNGSPPAARRQLWMAQEAAATRIRLGRAEWVIALGLLDLLFLVFVVLQVTVLFAGHDHVVSTAGLTYAEYARHGFGQLMVVGALTLGVVVAAGRFAKAETTRDRVALRVLLGLLVGLTAVVLASALRRLGLYEDAFGFTRERLIAHALIWWLAGIFVLVAAAGLTLRARWLPRAVVGFTGAALLAFSLMNPDGLIARRNGERLAVTGNVDLGYLASLSADAVPELARLPEPYRSCVLGEMEVAADSWSGFNLSRSRARMVLENARTEPASPCATEGT